MSSERVGVTSHPLYWPTGWKRTKYPEHARFNKSSVYHETQKVRVELAQLRHRLLDDLAASPHGANQSPVDVSLAVLTNDGVPQVHAPPPPRPRYLKPALQ